MSWKLVSIVLISVLFLGLAIETTFLVVSTTKPSGSTNAAPPAGNANTAGRVAFPPCEAKVSETEVTEPFDALVPEDWAWLEDNDYGFKIAHPRGWTVTKGPSPTDPNFSALRKSLLVEYSIEPPDEPFDGRSVDIGLYDEPLETLLGWLGGPQDGIRRVYNGPVQLNGLAGSLVGDYYRTVRDQENTQPIPMEWIFSLRGERWTATVGGTAEPSETWRILTSFQQIDPS